MDTQIIMVYSSEFINNAGYLFSNHVFFSMAENSILSLLSLELVWCMV